MYRICSDDRPFEAKCCFEAVLLKEPTFLNSYQNLVNLKQQMVERWHFRMLNDTNRNEMYKQAIQKAIQGNKYDKVLDIGTGTGLLSLYAHQAGAKHIFACELSPVMNKIATNVFKLNECHDRIKLLNKHSTHLDAEADLDGRVDLVFTETMDAGVFGEGLLQTLIHAKESLLTPNGRIIPGRVRLFLAGFQSRQLAQEHNVINSSSFTDTTYFRNLNLSANSSEPYDSCHVNRLRDFKLITKVEEGLNVNLNDLNELKALDDGTLKRSIRLAYTMPGNVLLDGFCVWFRLFLDEEEECQIDTNPFDPNYADSADNCWECAIFRLNHRFANTQKLKYLNVTVSCPNGVLTLSHYYDSYRKTYKDISSDVIQYLNDAEFINQMEFHVFNAMERKRKNKTKGTAVAAAALAPNEMTINTHGTNAAGILHNDTVTFPYVLDNVLDFLPFPTVGIALLKEKRLKTLYCSKAVEEFVRFVASANCIPIESFVFLEHASDVLDYSNFSESNEFFDIIVLPLIDRYGCPIAAEIGNYNHFKLKLKRHGFMVPQHLDMHFSFVYSKWLENVTRVTNRELNALHISSLINEYRTEVQLDLVDDMFLECLDRLDRHQRILLNDKSIRIEKNHYFAGGCDPLTTISPLINGILFYFKYFFNDDKSKDEPVMAMTTCRRNSFARMACSTVDYDYIQYARCIPTVFVQNNGHLKLSLTPKRF